MTTAETETGFRQALEGLFVADRLDDPTEDALWCGYIDYVREPPEDTRAPARPKVCVVSSTDFVPLRVLTPRGVYFLLDGGVSHGGRRCETIRKPGKSYMCACRRVIWDDRETTK